MPRPRCPSPRRTPPPRPASPSCALIDRSGGSGRGTAADRAGLHSAAEATRELVSERVIYLMINNDLAQGRVRRRRHLQRSARADRKVVVADPALCILSRIGRRCGSASGPQLRNRRRIMPVAQAVEHRCWISQPLLLTTRWSRPWNMPRPAALPWQRTNEAHQKSIGRYCFGSLILCKTIGRSVRAESRAPRPIREGG